MQTATATRRDPGFQALSEVPQQFIQTEPDDRRERYFFFAGDFPGCPPVAVEGPDGKTQKVHVGGTTVDTRCIPGRVIWRALVTPCISMPVDVQAHAIPVGRKLNGSEVYDRVNGGIVYAKMLEFSGPAANDLLRDFGNQTDDVDRQRGLVELAPELLTGQPWAKVQKLNITFMYFPNWPFDVPATHAEMREKVEAVLAQFESDTHPEFKFDANSVDSREAKAIYVQCGKDMLKAIDQAEAWHTSVAEKANINVARADTDTKHKEGFDELDTVAFLRTGIIQTTKQMQEMVKASREQRGANDSVANAVLAMAESNKQMLEAMSAKQQNEELAALRAELAEMREQMAAQNKPAAKKTPETAKG